VFIFPAVNGVRLSTGSPVHTSKHTVGRNWRSGYVAALQGACCMASAAVEDHRRRLVRPRRRRRGCGMEGRGCRWSSGRRRRERKHGKVYLRKLESLGLMHGEWGGWVRPWPGAPATVKKVICPQLAPPNPLRFNCFTECIPGRRITVRLVVESVASTDYCYLLLTYLLMYIQSHLEQHFLFSGLAVVVVHGQADRLKASLHHGYKQCYPYVHQ